jgi:ZIP family zinc transporter
MSGTLLPYFIKRKNIHFIASFYSFSQGVLLGVALFSFLIPALSLKINFFLFALSLIIFGMIIYLLNNFSLNNNLYLSLILRNIPQGLALGLSFSNNSLISSLLLVLSIALMNIPESFSLSYVLLNKNKDDKKIIRNILLCNLVEVVFTMIGLLCISITQIILPYFYLIGFISLIHMIIYELFPLNHQKSLSGFFLFLLGLLIIIYFTCFLSQ